MYVTEEFVVNPVPVTTKLAAAVVTVGVAGETPVIVSGTVVPLVLKLAVPITCPVSENGSGFVSPLKSPDHPTNAIPLPAVAVKSTVPAVKKASRMPFVPIELVPAGDEVTSLPPQVQDGSTIERKLGV